MKMKKIMATALISTIALGAAMPALAVEVGQAGSKGSVDFGEADDKPTPVDPTDPNVPPKPIVPEKPGEGGGTHGPLRFDRVPNLKFDTIAVSNSKQEGHVLEEAYKLVEAPADPTKQEFFSAPTVEISDLRGTSAGWHAQVKIDEVFKATGESDVKGAVSFAQGRVSGYTGQNASLAPIAKAVDLTKDNITFVNATDGTGIYQWGISYYSGDVPANGKPQPNYTTTPKSDEAIKLNVPTGQTVKIGKTYEAAITWTLLSTPDATFVP